MIRTLREAIGYANHGKKMGMALPGDWKNHHVKTFIQGKRNKLIHDRVQTHSTLSLIGSLQQIISITVQHNYVG